MEKRKQKYYKFNRRVFKYQLRKYLKPEIYKHADIDEYAKDYERGCTECGWSRGEYELPSYATKSGHEELVWTC